MTEYALTDADGTVRWRGTIDPPPGGGSQTDVYGRASVLFTETAGAGTYTGTIDIPAGGVVLAFAAYYLDGPWDADHAVIVVGDGDDPSGYCLGETDNAADIGTASSSGAGQPYDPTAPDFDVNYLNQGTQGGAYEPALEAGVATAKSIPGVLYRTGGTITATITTTGAGGTTGRVLLMFGGYGIAAAQTNAIKS